MPCRTFRYTERADAGRVYCTDTGKFEWVSTERLHGHRLDDELLREYRSWLQKVMQQRPPSKK